MFILALIFCGIFIFNVACGGDDDDDDDDGNEKPNPWKQQIIDKGDDVGRYNDLAVDSKGNAHVAYWDAVNMAAMYATNKGGAWESETLPNPIEQDVQGPTAIAVDSSNSVHVAYCSAGLVYAKKPGDNWNTPQNLDTEADCGDEIDLAVTADGDAHISYSTKSGAVKWYFVGSTNSTVDEAGSASAIAVSDLGSVFVSYAKGDGLYFATTQGAGGFSPVQVDSGKVGENSSIAYSGSAAHIAYYDQGAGNLKHASNADGSWVSSIIDDRNDVGKVPSIALDEAGGVHITYYGSPSLYYATDFSGVWEAAPADSKVGTGQTDTSLAIDDEGYLHISYYDVNDQILKYSVSIEPLEYLDL